MDSGKSDHRSVLISDFYAVHDGVRYDGKNPDQDTRMNELEILQGKYALLEAENTALKDSAAAVAATARTEAFTDAAQQFELVKLAADANIELPEEVNRADIPRLLDGVKVLVDAAVLGLTLDQKKTLEDPKAAMRQIIEDAMNGSGQKFSDAVVPEIYKFHVESKSKTEYPDGSKEENTYTSDSTSSTTTTGSAGQSAMLNGVAGDTVRLRDAVMTTANGRIDTMPSVTGLGVARKLRDASTKRNSLLGKFDETQQRMGA
jgi:hypothetical protein